MRRSVQVVRWYYSQYEKFANWYDERFEGNSFYLPLQVFGSLIPMVASAVPARLAYSMFDVEQLTALYIWIGGIGLAWVYLAIWLVIDGKFG